MIVVDTNVIASLWLATPHSSQAEAAVRRDPEWSAPLLWRSELRNVLASMVRSDRLGLADAIGIASTAEELLEGREYAVPSSDVLQAAEASGCTAYDSEFIVLARAIGCRLVTLDGALLRAFPGVAVSLRDFTA